MNSFDISSVIIITFYNFLLSYPTYRILKNYLKVRYIHILIIAILLSLIWYSRLPFVDEMNQFSLVRIDDEFRLEDFVLVFYNIPNQSDFVNISDYFTKMYRPIFFIITSAQYHLSLLLNPGDHYLASSFIYKLSVALHSQNTILCYVVIRNIINKNFTAFWGSIFYFFSYTALVPVGRVAWQTDLINAYICILSFSIIFIKSINYNIRNIIFFSFILSILQVFAMLNKETFFTFPVITMLYLIICYKEKAFKKILIFYYSFIPFVVMVLCLILRSIILNDYSNSLNTNYIYEYIHGYDRLIAPIEAYFNYFSLSRDTFNFASLNNLIEFFIFIPNIIIFTICLYGFTLKSEKSITLFLYIAAIPAYVWINHNMDFKYHHVYVFLSITLIFNTITLLYQNYASLSIFYKMNFYLLTTYIVFCMFSNVINFSNSNFSLKDFNNKYYYIIMN